jgi:hypothetical protein
MSARPATSDVAPCCLAASGDSATSGVIGPSTRAPRTMPSPAIALSDAASTVDANAADGASTAASSATAGVAIPSATREFDRVDRMSRFAASVGADVEAVVGDDQQLRAPGTSSSVACVSRARF